MRPTGKIGKGDKLAVTGADWGYSGGAIGGTPPLAAPAAPTLTLVSGANDNTPNSTVSNVLSGDVVRFQYATQSDFSDALEITGTASGTTIALVTGALADGPWYFRARIERSGYANSDWSNTVNETIDATAPTITSSNTDSINENATLSHSLTANESVTWSIVGGADQAQFEISGSTLRWASNGTRDFEAPADADTNNTYIVQVRATDTAGNASNQVVTVTVNDVADGSTTAFDPATKSADITLTNSDLTATCTNSGYHGARALANASSGKKYCELTMVVAPGGETIMVGIANGSFDFTGASFLGQTTNGVGHDDSGVVFLNGVLTTIQTFTSGDVVCMAVNLDAMHIWFRKNGGNWNNNGSADPATNTGGIDISALAAGPYYPATTLNGNNTSLTANFGGSSYAQTPPSGFGNW